MTKLLRASALAGLFIVLAVCGDEAIPTAEVAPLLSPVAVATPPPTLPPVSTATPTPPPPTAGVDRMQVCVGRHKTDGAAAPAPGIAVLPIDSDTTCRDLFETLSRSERN